MQSFEKMVSFLYSHGKCLYSFKYLCHINIRLGQKGDGKARAESGAGLGREEFGAGLGRGRM